MNVRSGRNYSVRGPLVLLIPRTSARPVAYSADPQLHGATEVLFFVRFVVGPLTTHKVHLPSATEPAAPATTEPTTTASVAAAPAEPTASSSVSSATAAPAGHARFHRLRNLQRPLTGRLGRTAGLPNTVPADPAVQPEGPLRCTGLMIPPPATLSRAPGRSIGTLIR